MRGVLATLLLCLAPLAAAADYQVEYNLYFEHGAFRELRVREVIDVHPDKDATPAPLRFRLPQDATSVVLGDALEQDGAEVVTREPVAKPTRFMLAYRIPGDGKRLRLVRKLTHPARSFSGYCPEGSFRVEADGIVSDRGVVQNGKTWVEFSARDLARDHEISITLTSIAVGNPIESLYPLLAGLILAGFFCLIGALSLGQRAALRADVKTCEYLDGQLAALEQAKAAGTVQEAFYAQRRKELEELLDR